MVLRLTSFLIAIGERTGRFFLNFPYVLATLLLYVGLSGVTYVWIKIEIPPGTVPHFFIAYELATGSDPLNFASSLQNHRLIWCWVLIFHVLSWLIVPVLVATTISAALHVWEERRLELDQLLVSRMAEVIRAQGEVTDEVVDLRAKRAREDMIAQIRRLKKQ